jgi:beta-N-acetylhexosaminidase
MAAPAPRRPPRPYGVVVRRRRRAAGAALVALSAVLALAIEAAAGDGRVGPSAGEIETLGRDAVSDRELIGQRLMVRMDGVATPELARQARRGEIGGVIVFPPAGQPTDELKDEIADLQRAARSGGRPPLLVAIDQEGGEVKRLPDGPPERSPSELAAPGDEPVARREGRATGRFLGQLGIDVDLASVLDVPSSPSSFISSRAFGADPRVVAANGVAFADGLERGGTVPTAKHFPGLGRAVSNTDVEPSEVDVSRSRLDQDLAPFREAIARGIPAVMTANATYRALDPDLPASLSPAIVGGLMRGELGFDGVVITDDLGAGAVRDVMPEPDAAAAAAGAGNDVLLLAQTGDAAEALAALEEAAGSGELDRAALERSALRVLALKGRR